MSKLALIALSIPLLLYSMNAHAQVEQTKLGILPPDYDYSKICKKDVLVTDNLKLKYADEKDITKLPEKNLVEFAKFYYRGDGIFPPDYDRARELVDYIIDNSQTKETLYRLNEALFIKYDMYLKGRGLPQNNAKAKEILDQLKKNGSSKAYSRYGDLYESEGQYDKAEASYKKAISLGESSKVFSLARLHYDKKIPTSEEQTTKMIILAQNSGLEFLARGNCQGLMHMALLYRYMSSLPDAEYYSVKWFEQAASLDNAGAKMYLAELVQRGFAIKKPFSFILELWHEAANLGSPRAMFYIGDYELNHAKTLEEKQKAIEWFEKAAKYRYIKASEVLANLYDGRQGIPQDNEKHQYWLEQAVAQNSSRASSYVALAKIYELEDAPNYEKLFQLYQKAANLGDDNAYIKIGDYYRYGIGRPAQPTKALRYYRLAAGNLKTSAMESLKEAYSCEIGKKYDSDKIEFWNNQIKYFSDDGLLKSAYDDLLSYPTKQSSKIKEDLEFSATAKSNGAANIYLGIYALKEKDKEKSNKMFQKALNLDLQDTEKYKSHYLLGSLLLDGKILDKDENLGVDLLKKAANSNHESANNLLGAYYHSKNDNELAKQYLEKAARQGKTSAFSKLASIYKDSGDKEKTISILKKSAMTNDIGSMIKLAGIYNGQEWEDLNNSDLSQYWFNQALASYPCDSENILKIAQSYQQGKNGAPNDNRLAEIWLLKLDFDAMDNSDEKFEIAEFYLNSTSPTLVEKKRDALKYIESRATDGNQQSIELLASYYLTDTTDKPSVNKAINWLEKSANNGNVASMMELANLYISGYSIDTSQEKAIYWLTQAKNKGSDKASNLLGIMFNDQ